MKPTRNASTSVVRILEATPFAVLQAAWDLRRLLQGQEVRRPDWL